jgi:hypothetical protein
MLNTFRKYYLPGIISLVGVLIIYIIGHFENKERALEITFGGVSSYSSMKTMFSKKDDQAIFCSLINVATNTPKIREAFIKVCNSKEHGSIVFDINSILYQDFVQIINQSKIAGFQNCYNCWDTLYVTNQNMDFTNWCGPSPNLMRTFKTIEMPPKIVLEKGKLRTATKTEILIDNCYNFLDIYIFLILPLFGMLFFYFILPFIQSKRQINPKD